MRHAHPGADHKKLLLMPKKKNRSNPIFVSPDGGETVYEQLPNGKRSPSGTITEGQGRGASIEESRKW